MSWLGIDLGTSGVKAVIIGDDGGVLAQATAPLDLSRPHPMWSEQDPEAWWRAAGEAVVALGPARTGVRGIGLSGQMHGAVVLDAADRVLRPAILWNDGRSHAECRALDTAARRVAGNRAMPGFTAPKLLWLRAHEPAVFAATRRVLLPKDWLRLRMVGEAVSEMSDAAGTLWLDVAARAWSGEMLALTGLGLGHMPRLVEGSEVSGTLRAAVAAEWGLPPGIVVAGGGGDNAAGAVGIGCIALGDAFVSLGTSGVVFVADAAPMPDPERTVHAFCHALPGRWHRMAVILSAAAALSWATRVLGSADEAALLAEVEAAGAPASNRVVFLPYLAGERTPHDDPAAAGVWFGLEGASSRADLARAVLEGVAFALADGLDALQARGGRIPSLSVIGGGARSALWGRILATALDRDLVFRAGGEVGPALGAARLAMLAGGADLEATCTEPPIARIQPPEPALAEGLARRRAIFRSLYRDLAPRFAETA
jgi:xylulokinase